MIRVKMEKNEKKKTGNKSPLNIKKRIGERRNETQPITSHYIIK
jgi:hypothetical protein